MLKKLKQRLFKCGKFSLIMLTVLLAGCFNDIQGPGNSLVWVSKPLTLDQYRGDSGELQHSLGWQTGVLDMAFDEQSGLLWALRKNGELAAYDADAVQVNLGHVELGGSPKNVFLRAHGGNVWLAAHKSLRLITTAGAQWQIDVEGNILGIELDSGRNRLWVVTDKKILGYDAGGALYIAISLPKKTDPLGPIAYDVINDRIFIAADKELHAYALSGTLVRRASLGRIEQLVADVAGTVWAADNKKLYRLNPLTLAVISSQVPQQRIAQLRRDPFNPGVWALAEDAISWVNAQGAYQGSFFAGLVPKLFAVAYRLEMDTRPELSIVQPPDQALVGPHPEFVLHATDDSGIAPASFSFKVNAVAAASTCGPDASQVGHYRCNLQAALHEIAQPADARYRVEVTVADNHGTVSLPAILTVLLDRDRDGVNDAADLCPNTPIPEAVDANGCSASQRDADHDTVTDDRDLCPHTPAGEVADAFGCSASQRDTDGDEITDNLDICPETPAGEPADANGCSASQRDSDRDGVTDNLDQCPHTPDGVAVDGSGCADTQRDSDHDTVNDALDQCPNTPMVEVADANGCSASQRDSDRDTVTDDRDLCPHTPDDETADAFGCSPSQLDTDGDTITDNLDQCPATPDGEAADANGCSASQRDTDGDTVTDNIDQCPATPQGETADANGCGPSQRDTDGDSVTDDLDQCPATPEGEPVDAQGCGASQRDGDGDTVSDAADDCPATPAGTPVGTDGCADFERDTDHDGVPDIQDAFPNDPMRSQLPAPLSLVANLQAADESILLSWQPPQNPENVYAYHIYRSDALGAELQRINTTPIADLSFMDPAVVNGRVYRYYVVAITQGGLEGQPGEAVAIFAAYNNSIIAGLTAVRAPINVNLSWQPAANVRYRIYRAVDSAGFAMLADVEITSYQDATLWSSAYQYRVVTLLDLFHPETSQTITVEGPPATASVDALLPLDMEVADTVPATDGVLEKISLERDQVVLHGLYRNALAPVSITATSGGQTFNTAGDNGTFRLVLPEGAPGSVWELVVAETATPNRTASARVRVLYDATPPLIELDNPAHSTVSSDSVAVSGTVTDNSGTIASLHALSDRFAGVVFDLATFDNNRFSGDIPLVPGANVLTVRALDRTGNPAQVQLTVIRSTGLAPTIEIHAPLNGTNVQTDRVDVSGVLYTGVVPENIRIVLGGNIIFPEAGAAEGVYPFTFSGISLARGLNNLTVRAETTAGNASAAVAVILGDGADEPDPAAPPVIQLNSPLIDGLYTSRAGFTIAGTVLAAAGPVTLAINGQPVSLIGPDNTGGSFSYTADLSAVSGQAAFTLVAVDAGNSRMTQRVVTINRDAVAPVINLSNSGLQAPPAVNDVFDQPYRLAGSVSDPNLAGVQINGRTVNVSPASIPGEYGFDVALEMPLGAVQAVDLLAWDKAGNQSNIGLLLNATQQVALELVTPRDGSELIINPANPQVEVIVRFTSPESVSRVTASVDQGGDVELLLDGNVATGFVTVTGQAEHQLTLSALDAGGQLLARNGSRFLTQDAASIPLAIDKTQPFNNERGVETNQAVTVFFNRPVNPALVQITVNETAHGLGYDLNDQRGKTFVDLPPPKLVEVHRDMATVQGGLFYGQDNRFVSFNPAQSYSYEAQVYVEVNYDGDLLGRFNFNTKSLPTLVGGLVVDQYGTALGGIEVMLPDFGLTAITKSNGLYTLRIENKTEEIRSGRYKLTYNAGPVSAGYGSVIRFIDLQAERLNRLDNQIVPQLSMAIPYVSVSSGQANALLDQGKLQLDLTDARLTLPNGRGAGPVHVQFTLLEHLSVDVEPPALPFWMYSIQPADIAVEGGVGIKITMPPMYDSFDYIPQNGTLVALLAFDLQTRRIIPVGVGRINNGMVESVGSIQLNSLNYLGYALMDAEGQAVLQRFVDGEAGLGAQLPAALDELINR